jgi:hypothetical protein
MVDPAKKSRGRSREKFDSTVSTKAAKGGLKGHLRTLSQSLRRKARSICKVVQEQELKHSSRRQMIPSLETPTGDILMDLHRQETGKDDTNRLSVIQECRTEEDCLSRCDVGKSISHRDDRADDGMQPIGGAQYRQRHSESFPLECGSWCGF